MTGDSQSTRGNSELPLYVGADVGGTGIKIGLVGSLGRTLAKQSIPTRQERGPQAAMAELAAVARNIVADAGFGWDDVAAIGLATPGPMDIPNGMLLQPHNLPTWWHFPIRDELAQVSQKRVVFANDANAAAFGEFWIGSGRQYPSLVMFTLGTGLGGGIIVHDMSIDGAHSHGGECGHIIIDYHETARLCGCGHRGHLEAYVSAVALVDRTEEALRTGRVSSLRSVLDAGEELTPLIVAEHALQGDSLADEIIMETARYLGIGVVSIMHTIDPSLVVLGGAMTFGGAGSPGGKRFLQRVKEEVSLRALPALAEKTKIEFASLGSDAGYLGAAGVARMQLLREKG